MWESLFVALVVAAATGAVSGLVTWVAMRIEVRYLRRDVDRAHLRLDNLPCGGMNRRASDCQPQG